jgi:uncharacterized repeat protein (TIGR01451 family)
LKAFSSSFIEREDPDLVPAPPTRANRTTRGGNEVNSDIPAPPSSNEARIRKGFLEPFAKGSTAAPSADVQGLPPIESIDPPSLSRAATPTRNATSTRNAAAAEEFEQAVLDFPAIRPDQRSFSTNRSSRRSLDERRSAVQNGSTNDVVSYPREQPPELQLRETSDSPEDSSFPSVPRKSTKEVGNAPATYPGAPPSYLSTASPQPALQPLVGSGPATDANLAPKPLPSLPPTTNPIPIPNPNAAKLPGALLALEMPLVSLQVVGPSAMQVQQSTHYQLVATNHGSESLSGLLVRANVPAGIQVSSVKAGSGDCAAEPETDQSTSVVWQLQQLGPNQTKSLDFELLTGRPEHFAVDLEWTAMPQAGNIPIAVEQAELQMALEGPTEATFGRPELYRLRVRNPGNAEAKNVVIVLSAEPYGSNQTEIGSVPAGGERLVEVELTFQEAGPITILADAKSAQNNLSVRNQVEVMVSKAQLAAKWLVPAEQYRGGLGEYELLLTNEGPIACEQVKCMAKLPASAQVMSIPEGSSHQGNEVAWTIGRIEPGRSMSYRFQLQINDDGEAPFVFHSQGSAGGAATAQAITRVESLADLKLTVNDPTAPAAVGRVVTYELSVVNRGSRPATGVKVLAQFSNGIEPVAAAGQAHRIVPGQVLFENIPKLAPGESITLTVNAEASEPGSHRFRAVVTCDDSEVQLLHEESTRYIATGGSSTSSIRR